MILLKEDIHTGFLIGYAAKALLRDYVSNGFTFAVFPMIKCDFNIQSKKFTITIIVNDSLFEQLSFDIKEAKKIQKNYLKNEDVDIKFFKLIQKAVDNLEKRYKP